MRGGVRECVSAALRREVTGSRDCAAGQLCGGSLWLRPSGSSLLCLSFVSLTVGITHLQPLSALSPRASPELLIIHLVIHLPS